MFTLYRFNRLQMLCENLRNIGELEWNEIRSDIVSRTNRKIFSKSKEDIKMFDKEILFAKRREILKTRLKSEQNNISIISCKHFSHDLTKLIWRRRIKIVSLLGERTPRWNEKRERENRRFDKKNKRERKRKEVEEVRGYIGIANKEMGSAGERRAHLSPVLQPEEGGKERFVSKGIAARPSVSICFRPSLMIVKGQ